jgi:hypothetical protein
VGVGLTVDIKGDTSNLDAALDKSSGKLGGFGDVLGGLPIPALAVAGAATAAAAAVIKLTDAAAQDRDEQEKLTATIVAAGAAHGDYAAQVDAAIAAGQALAFSDSEVRAGLEQLVTATGDVGQATELLTLSQNVARRANVDLETASKAVAKAHAGQTGALEKLLPGMGKSTSSADALAKATKLAAGQADTYAKSSEGMKVAAKDAFGEIGETIGSAFLPVMDEVLPALLPVIQQLAKLVVTILPLLIPLVKLLAGALSIVAKVLGTLVGWLVQLVSWLTRAIDKLGAFLAKLNPLKGLKLPSIPGLNATGASAPGPAAYGASSGGSSPGVQVNVYGALDPEAVARQIRRILDGHAARTGQAVAI